MGACTCTDCTLIALRRNQGSEGNRGASLALRLANGFRVDFDVAVCMESGTAHMLRESTKTEYFATHR